MKNPIKKMLRTHKEYCKINEYSLLEDRSCTCGRDAALQLYEDIEALLLKVDEWLEDQDSYSSKSSAHVELDSIIARLV